jgi:serine/threonine-protein kinase
MFVAWGATPAWADPAANAAAAQVLFDEAKAAMQRGDYAPACPNLEESERLQPAGGTLLFLGLCYEGTGRTASAWTRFNEALSAARRDSRPDRERVATEHLAALTPKLTTLSVVVADENKSIPGIRVTRDGNDTPRELWATPVPVDPGRHTVRVEAPGMKAWATEVVAGAAGAASTVRVPPLERDGMPAPALAPAVPPAALPPPPAGTPGATSDSTGAPPSLPPSPESTHGKSQRVVALALGGAGLVGLGVGTYFGVAALSKKGQETKANGCPDGSSGGCTSNGVDISKEAVRDGNISTVLLGVGAAAVVGGVVVWLTSPSASASVSVTPTVARGGAGLGLSGSW